MIALACFANGIGLDEGQEHTNTHLTVMRKCAWIICRATLRHTSSPGLKSSNEPYTVIMAGSRLSVRLMGCTRRLYSISLWNHADCSIVVTHRLLHSFQVKFKAFKASATQFKDPKELVWLKSRTAFHSWHMSSFDLNGASSLCEEPTAPQPWCSWWHIKFSSHFWEAVRESAEVSVR